MKEELIILCLKTKSTGAFAPMATTEKMEVMNAQYATWLSDMVK